jgi:hypothetical protein
VKRPQIVHDEAQVGCARILGLDVEQLAGRRDVFEELQDVPRARNPELGLLRFRPRVSDDRGDVTRVGLLPRDELEAKHVPVKADRPFDVGDGQTGVVDLDKLSHVSSHPSCRFRAE